MSRGSTSVETPPDEALVASRLDGLSADHLRQLVALSLQFNGTLNTDELIPRILDSVLETIAAEGVSIWLRDGDQVRCEAARGEHGDALTGIEVPIGFGFAGWAVAKGKPVLVHDASSDQRYVPQIDEAAGFRTRSVMAVPLTARGETLGALEVVNARNGAGFDLSQLAFLLAMADDAASAMHNARLLEAARQAHDLRSLLDFSREVLSTFDLDRIHVSIVNLAGEALHFDRCVLATWQGSDLVVRAISGETKVDQRAAALKEIDRFMTWATEGREELLVADVTSPTDETAGRVRDSFARYLQESGARCILVEDIRDSEGDLGVLLLEFTRPDAVTPWARQAARMLANQAALALRNAQLYAGVPFIGWLEPLARKKQQLTRLPRALLIRYAIGVAVVLLLLMVIRMPLRISAAGAHVRAAVQQPARAGVSGILDAVLVEEASTVAVGQPIARLRDDDGQLRLREAQATLELVQREALAAEANGDANGAARARVRATEALTSVNVLRRQQDRTMVMAPAAGIVLTPRLDERVGSFVAAGSTVAWIGDPDWVEIELQVDQKDIGAVQLEDRVRARIAAHPSVTFQGRVVAIAPRADTASASTPLYTVRAILDNRQRLLRPGMNARAKLLTASRPIGVVVFRRPVRWLRMQLWWILPW